MSKKRKENEEESASIKDWIISILIAVGIAIVIKMFFFDFVVVQGPSMQPTLHQGQRLVINKIEYRVGEPDYGDIVVLRFSPGVDYVKRVIAKGGDTIEIKNMKVYRNGKLLKESYISQEPYGDYPKTTVPKGKYFVMGDNRANSSDSRFTSLGFVDSKDMIGHVVFRFWPFNKWGTIGN
ncbi:MAG: signal peptidase I [Eubacteriaceae bacterium]|uniref:Signal peptidase I n=1 Tax=Candidatus Pseudoramibacter fermentans TaxID=2594427 RepID=A0A6L5GRM2_9FIRM|nr:signal peptidase I [Candidatus Pseudoramibacter fermentans]RRF93856.1 MAG: signal peptidase I [Eubacteriaceae bacterium]